MDVRKCPDCGEMYSVSYRKCPFCQEEKRGGKGAPKRRAAGGGRRVAAKEPSVVGPVAVIVALLLFGLLVYLFFGDALADTLGFGDDSSASDVSDAGGQQDPAGGDETPGPDETPGGTGADSGDTMPEDGGGDDVTPPPDDGGDTVPPEDGDDGNDDGGASGSTALALSREDFTLIIPGDQVYTLTVAGGAAPYTWTTGNSAIATVDANGKVEAVSGGVTTLTVRDSAGAKAECIVRVKGPAAKTGNQDDNNGAAATGGVTLNYADVTIAVEEKLTVTASGGGSYNWSVDNSSVATVDAEGRVIGVSPGVTTLTVTSGDETAKCIIRVKSA